MDCPVCSVQLLLTDRQGIEIDYCPKCRGIWLDRGELDKLVERSVAVQPPGYDYGRQGQQETYGHDRRPAPREREYEEHDKHGRKRKRRSFLEDIFDFD